MSPARDEIRDLLAAILLVKQSMKLSDKKLGHAFQIPTSNVFYYTHHYFVEWQKVDESRVEQLREAAMMRYYASTAECPGDFPDRRIELMQKTVLSECCWIVKRDEDAKNQVRRYVSAMRRRPASWWLELEHKPISWWLSQVANYADAERAAA